MGCKYHTHRHLSSWGIKIRTGATTVRPSQPLRKVEGVHRLLQETRPGRGAGYVEVGLREQQDIPFNLNKERTENHVPHLSEPFEHRRARSSCSPEMASGQRLG